MKRKLLIIGLMTLAIVSMCGIASACVDVNLPQDPVTLSVNRPPGIQCYFNTTLKDVPTGYDVYNGTYLGWCGHKNQNIVSDYDYTNTFLYSSYDYTMPSYLWHENLSKVNYLLNNKIENVDWWQTQYVIWYLLDFEDSGLNDDGWSMYENASLYGAEYCPNYNEIIAIIGDPGEGVQIHILELLLVEPEPEDDEPPSKVENLSVVDAKNGKLDLTWDPAVDNVGVDHYEIWRDGAFLVNDTGTTYLDTGLVNGQLYTYTVRAVDAEGNKGEFSDPASGTPTKTSSSSGPTKPKPKINEPPHANSDGPYSGIEKTIVIFNGSKSYDHDHYIISWLWDFGDGTTLEGEVVEHIYSIPGEYTVKLTVTDTKGAKDTDVTIAVINPPNRPPSVPEIIGPEVGIENLYYGFSIVSTDADNDNIFYIIDWGDGSKTISDYLPSGEYFNTIYNWKEPGKYTITVTADDDQATSYNEVTITINEPKTPEENNFILILLALLAFMLLLLFLLLAKKKKKGDKE